MQATQSSTGGGGAAGGALVWGPSADVLTLASLGSKIIVLKTNPRDR